MYPNQEISDSVSKLVDYLYQDECICIRTKVRECLYPNELCLYPNELMSIPI